MQHNCSIDLKDSGVFLANEKKTKWVILITVITMIAEITVGYWSGSMALLADGWHMASHSMALLLSLVVYYLYRHPKFRSSFTFGGGKVLSLGGYTSSLILIFVGGSMIYESIEFFFRSPEVHYNEALIVAIFGLVINLICAFILHDGSEGHDHSHGHGHNHGHSHGHKHVQTKNHCDHDHGHEHVKKKAVTKDHNHESAYVHIITDALTSVLAILALVLGKYVGWSWLDPAVGVLGGIVVIRWALGLIRQSGMDLLDAHDSSIDRESLVDTLEKDGSKVVDMHLWKIDPSQIGCEIIIKRTSEQTSSDYRDLIQKKFEIQHLVIEVI